MVAHIPIKDRQVVPRWRDSVTTAKLGELGSVDNKQTKPGRDGSNSNRRELFQKKLERWNRDRNIVNASELVGAAIVLGLTDEIADVAAYLLKHSPRRTDATGVLALAALSPQRLEPVGSLQEAGKIGQLEYARISALKTLVKENPRDGISWTDLALAYTTMGQLPHAEKCISIALQLGRENRFILRSASRFFIHLDDPDRAHFYLRKSPAVKSDPWVLAAEIACADAAETKSRNIVIGRRLVKEWNGRPRSISELASAIGSIEIRSGAKKKGKELVITSLLDPTENAIAQASWLSRNKKEIEISEDLLVRSDSAEARVWEFYRQQAWQGALEEARKWHLDQPFSSNPSILGAYIAAAALEDYATSVQLCKMGLYASPHNPTLINNLVFALVQANQTEEAAQLIRKVNINDLTEIQKAAWIATMGLYSYRTGDVRAGRNLYDKALAIANNIHHLATVQLASLFQAFEEANVNTKESAPRIIRALEMGKESEDPIIHIMVDRLILRSAQSHIELPKEAITRSRRIAN